MALCVASSKLSEIVTQVILYCNLALLLGVSLWSFLTIQKNEKFDKSSFFKKIQYFAMDLWQKKSFITPVLAHIADQATDIGTILEFYALHTSKTKRQQCKLVTIKFIIFSFFRNFVHYQKFTVNLYTYSSALFEASYGKLNLFYKALNSLVIPTSSEGYWETVKKKKCIFFFFEKYMNWNVYTLTHLYFYMEVYLLSVSIK